MPELELLLHKGYSVQFQSLPTPPFLSLFRYASHKILLKQEADILLQRAAMERVPTSPQQGVLLLLIPYPETERRMVSHSRYQMTQHIHPSL